MSDEQKQIDDGGPAFPQHGWTSDPETLRRMQQCGMGLSLRDYFAAKAMQGLVSLDECIERGEDGVAELSYRVADAMLAARKGGAS